jgi:hypothetical protein
MARNYGRLLTRIWHDEEFLALSSGAQRLYMLAISQDTLTYCGVTTWTYKRWARLSANTTPKTIVKDLTELAGAGFVLVDEDTEELWVRSFLKWDGVLDSPNLIVAMTDAFNAVHSGRIREAIVEWFVATYPQGFRSYLTEGFPKGFPKGFPEGFLEALGEGFREGPPRAHARGHARTPSPATAPTPSPSPDPSTNGGDLALRTETETNQNGNPEVDLAKRLAAICTGTNRAVVNTEALTLVHWALGKVAPHIVEEAIGWASTKPPTLPRAVAKVVQSKARDHGITLTDFQTTIGVA